MKTKEENIKDLIQKIDEICLNYAMTPKNTALEEIILIEVATLLTNFFDVIDTEICEPNFYLYFTYDECEYTGDFRNFEVQQIQASNCGEDCIYIPKHKYGSIDQQVDQVIDDINYDSLHTKRTEDINRILN